MFVRYRFSRQPLNRLIWNFAWCFEMVSERQLTILVTIGCIINELLHKLGGSGAQNDIETETIWRHNTMSSLHWDRFIWRHWSPRNGVNNWPHYVRNIGETWGEDGWRATGSGRWKMDGKLHATCDGGRGTGFSRIFYWVVRSYFTGLFTLFHRVFHAYFTGLFALILLGHSRIFYQSRFLTGCTASLYYITQCLSVCLSVTVFLGNHWTVWSEILHVLKWCRKDN